MEARGQVGLLLIAALGAAQLLPTPKDGDIRTVYWELQNVSDVWLTLEPPPGRRACPDILEISPEPIATSRLRIEAPRDARSVAISIPNVAGRSGLPIHTQTLALP